MTALSNLQKKLEKESQGIMFPFSANASTVSTTQNVYDSATDGIMTMTGQKYVGPDAVVQYGTEEQGYPRQLKQIEAPMLPQFDADQFPKAGEGIMQTPTPAPTPPVETEPEAPAMDPCPPGFKFDPVKKVCVPIEQPKEDRNDSIIDRRRNIGDTANALGQVTDAINSLPGEQGEKLKGTYGKDVNLTVNNDIPWLKFIPLIGTPINMYLKSRADKQLQTLNGTEGISVTKNKDGTYNVNVTEEKGKANFGRLQTKESLVGNMASTQKKDATGNIVKAPNGQNMIQGPLTLSAFGKTNLFQPTTRTPAETDALNIEEKNKLLSELDAALGLDSTATVSKPVTVDPQSSAADATDTSATGEGTLDKFVEEPEGTFGELQKIPVVNQANPSQNVGTVNSRLMKDTGTSLKLSQTLMNMIDTYREIANPVTEQMARKKLEKQETEALEQFNTSIEEDNKKGGDYSNNLTKSQAEYLNQNNRKALPGESKSNDGYLAGGKFNKNKTKENNGYGFKATQGNYNKSTKTFDQRFK